jgi:hypothetical protein
MFRFKSNGNTAADKPASSPITEKELPVTHKPIMTPSKDYQPPKTPEITDAQQKDLERLGEYMNTIILPATHEYYENEKRFLSAGTLKRYMRARKWDYEVRKIKKLFHHPILITQVFCIYKQIRPRKKCWKILLNGEENIDLINWSLIISSQR